MGIQGSNALFIQTDIYLTPQVFLPQQTIQKITKKGEIGSGIKGDVVLLPPVKMGLAVCVIVMIIAHIIPHKRNGWIAFMAISIKGPG